MTQLTNGAEAKVAILAVHNLKKLARETSTDVEGVVAWLQSSYNPVDALDKLLEQQADPDTPDPEGDTSHVNNFSWVS
jgi:hypothetical protein